MTLLTILHTNDLHGRVEQMARIATIGKRIRREVASSGAFCALWDAGDAEDRTWFESSMTKGSAAMALLHAASYDLAALGNSTPMCYGPQVIPALAARFGKSLLAANLFDAPTGGLYEGLAPFAVETFGAARVGIIGLTAAGSLYSAFKDVWLRDPIQLLPDLIGAVRARGARTIVLLSHLGFSDDQKVAATVDGLDLIIGGHSHTQVCPPLIVNGTLIAQAGEYGRWLGRLDLEIDPHGKITHHRAELIPVGEDIPLDPDVTAALALEKENVQQMTRRVIGELCDPIDLADDKECRAGNLLADALLAHVQGAEIAIVLAGHWTTGLDAGPLTLGALNVALRSTANPARVKLTGQEIAHFLREALKPENAGRKPHILRGAAFGWPHVAGLTVRYAPDTVELLGARGEPLQMDRAYVVAGTDLEFGSGPGNPKYLAIPEKEVEFEVPTIMPEIMEEYIAAHSPLSAPTVGRIKRRLPGE